MAALVLASWSASHGLAQLPTIEVSSFSRQAAQLGSTFELRANGGRLEELDALVCSQPGLTATIQTTAPRLLADEPTRNNVFSVSVAAGAPRGLCDVQAHGRFGLSNPRRILLTSKAVELATSEHSNAATPMELPANVVINDRCLPQKRNYFRVSLAAGEQLHCVAYSQQIDSKASLNMILLDASERELARHRSIGDWPAEIQYVAKEPQDVLVLVHDFLYQGGDDFAFLFEAVATSVDAPAPTLELNELLRPSAQHVVGNETSASETSASETSVIENPAPENPASESPPSEAEGGLRTAPFSLLGRFEGEPVQCDFTAKAQQALSIRVRSAEFGQLTDPSIVIYKLDANGNPNQLANEDDQATVGGPAVRLLRTDPRMTWTAPEDATYRIAVFDNQSGDRPQDAAQFSLIVSELRPSFRLLAYQPFPTNAPAASRPFGTQLLKGGTDPISVMAIREDGFNEALEVAVEGLPAGVNCPNMIMPAGANDTTLVLRCSEDAAAWTGELKIVGRAKLGEQALEVFAETVTVSNPATTTKNAIQHRATEQLLTAINTLDTAPLLVELGDGSVVEVAQGAKVAIPIKATRREGGKAECTLRPQDLPPKSTLAEIKIPADQTDVTAELNIAADAPLGEFTFWMQNETKVKMRPNPQSLEREEAYLAKLKSALETEAADEQKAKLNEAITAVTAAVEELKKQTAEQEFSVWLPTTPQRIRITPKP